MNYGMLSLVTQRSEVRNPCPHAGSLLIKASPVPGLKDK